MVYQRPRGISSWFYHVVYHGATVPWYTAWFYHKLTQKPVTAYYGQFLGLLQL